MYVCNIYTYIYVNICIWRWTQGEETDVTAPELPFTYRIFNTLVPLQSCRSRMQKNNPFRNMTTELNREQQLWSGNENVEIRYVNGSSGAGTSASSPGVYRHIYIMYIHYIHLYIYMPSISHTEKPSCIYMFIYYIYIYYIITYISYIVYLYICLLLAVQKTYKYVKS